MTRNDENGFHLKLTGEGISVERPITGSVARQIMTLIMGGTGGATNGEAPALGHDSLAGTLSRNGTLTPKTFMTIKKPGTDKEKVTCLAYYLTHTQKITAFKTKELTELNIEAAQHKLANPSGTARNAVSDGLLSLAGGGRKKITARGEALVEALPDREKIHAALAAHPVRIRKAKRKRSSTRKA